MSLPTEEQRNAWRAERGLGMISAVGEYTPDEFWELLDAVDELEETLRLVLPMAKGYAHAHPVGANAKLIERAELILSSNAQVQLTAAREEK